MKISLEWLGDMVEWLESDPAEIARRLTLSTAEIEEVEDKGKLLEYCCVARVAKLAKHPNADKLSLTELETDRGIKKVVCGGTNLKEGMLVALAHVGATVKLHGGELMALKAATIRGEPSEGMICAAMELGLEEMFPPKPEDGERPVVDLSDTGCKPGTPLREALGLGDVVLHISNTAITQRPDLFSHLGFARECVAIGLARWKKKPEPKAPAFAKSALPFSIKSDTDAVPRYCACLIEIDALGETPEWMKRRLEATGWRSVSLPVDITNYVTMELGMPLHSFDADDLKGDVRIHLSKEGDTLTTLDDVERALPEGAVVLSDKEGIFDLLGIMGGLRSSTKPTTRRVLLHSAIVDPVRIRRAIVATGHRTDAATVYEKGIPRIAAEMGFHRALELFLAHVPGARVASSLDAWGDNGEAPVIELPTDRVRSMLGIDLSDARIAELLKAIECEVEGKEGALRVTPPLHRLRDLGGPHDLIEEIGRLHGYERVESVMPAAELGIPQRDKDVHAMRESLKGERFMEIVPLSFAGPKTLLDCGLDPDACVKVNNPLGETTSLLEPSLLPGLLEHARDQIHLADEGMRTFRWGHTFARDRDERMEMGLLCIDRHPAGLLNEPLLKLRDTLDAILGAAGRSVTLEPHPTPPPFAHPGRCARLRAKDGKEAGLLFELHPQVAGRFELPGRTSVALVNLSCLLADARPITLAQPLPHFPDVTYDETFPRAHADPIGPAIEKAKSAHPLLESVSIKDLYAGKDDQDSYSITLRFVYRAPDRTLTEEEAKTAHQKVLAALSA
jgi:phenylalanyl-tRNA synthetase beta chain